MNTGEPDAQASQRWAQEFEKVRHLYEKLQDTVVYDLNQVLRDRDLDSQIHGGVTYRVKETESFRKKISRKSYTDPLKNTRDLLGVRIVCLYPSVLRDIDKVINETFKVVRFEDKSQGPSPELWRYSSIHYDCKLDENCSGPRYDDLKDLVFEIQVRTILQDAWATVEHKLGYKNEKQIPDELKREFSALAGLFHVADQRFQFIADRMQDRSQDIAKQLSHLYRRAIELAEAGETGSEDAVSIEAKIKELERRSGAIVDRGTVKALLRGMYLGREHGRNYDYSLFVQALESGELSSLGALGQLLLQGHLAARKQEGKQIRLADVEFARLAISSASPKFHSIHKQHGKR